MKRYSVSKSGMVHDDHGDWVRFEDCRTPATVIMCGDREHAMRVAETLIPEVENVQVLEVQPNSQTFPVTCRGCGKTVLRTFDDVPKGWYISSDGTFACSSDCVYARYRNKDQHNG